MRPKAIQRVITYVKELNRARLRNRRAPQRHAYRRWVLDHDTATAERVSGWRSEMNSMPSMPVISVLMPVYRPDMRWLEAAVESVFAQVYPYWELCIADDNSPEPDVRVYLETLCERDARVKVAFRTTNGHISECSNSALSLCSGSHVALLDQDDLLAPQALLRVAQVIARQPQAGVIYSDEDKLGPDGVREAPSRKSAWHMSMLEHNNLISHLGVYRTELMKSIGGFRKGLEGAQDHDLALRCTEILDASDIVHIPEILYHWRVHPNSTASSVDAKPYAIRARERCLKEHEMRMRQLGPKTNGST